MHAKRHVLRVGGKSDIIVMSEQGLAGFVHKDTIAEHESSLMNLKK